MGDFLRRRARSFGYAFTGVWYALRTQPNLWIHLFVAAAAVAVGLWLALAAAEWAILVLTIALVLTAELFNTAVEAAIDRLGPEQHPLAKIAKDVSAAAVLMTALAAVIVGLLLLGPPLWEKLFP